MTHAYNPNFDGIHISPTPMLNKGIVLDSDPNGHMTTTAPGIVLCRMIADMCDCELQSTSFRELFAEAL